MTREDLQRAMGPSRYDDEAWNNVTKYPTAELRKLPTQKQQRDILHELAKMQHEWLKKHGEHEYGCSAYCTVDDHLMPEVHHEDCNCGLTKLLALWPEEGK